MSSIVRAAGRARLEGKAAVLEGQIIALGAEQALFGALLDAAGYNRVPCAALAERVPIARLHDLLAGKSGSRAQAIATVVLLGLAGLLPPEAEELRDPWHRYANLWSAPLHPDDWVRSGVRPANRPELRLRGIAVLIARHAHEGLVAGLLAPLHGPENVGADRVGAALEVVADAGGTLPPIGRRRASEMAINVVVPFALALARSGAEEGSYADLEERAWRTATALPGGEDSESVRHMRALLAGAGHRPRGIGALETQGLLHLYRSYCGAHVCWEWPLSGQRTAVTG